MQNLILPPTLSIHIDSIGVSQSLCVSEQLYFSSVCASFSLSTATAKSQSMPC